jgi:hypothetical protein
LKNFHAGLLAEISSLAEKSGMLTSADLCPVRFRLRFADGIGHPSTEWRATLSVVKPGGTTIDHTGAGGIVEFGLMPPGRYHLNLSLADSYTLRDDFEVLPGVPIDRLLRCPHSSPPNLAVAIEIVWPEGVDGDRILAVCDVERDAVTVGECLWRPQEEVPLPLVAATGRGDSADEELLWAIDELEPEGAEPVRSVPHRYCRLRGIRVYRCGPEADGSPETTAQCVFGDRGDDGAIVCAGPAPGFRWDGGDLNPVWRLPAPDELVAELRRLSQSDVVTPTVLLTAPE